MDIEKVFGEIGEMGRAQSRLFVMISLPAGWISLHTFITNFIGTDPGWNCTVSTISTVNGNNCSGTSSGGVSVTITDPVEKCKRYEARDCIPQFDTSEYTSIVSEWELICSRSSYPNLSQSCFFLGLMIGAWLFGSFTDTYGRKKTILLGLIGCTVTGLSYSMSSGFVMFAMFRMLMGIAKQCLVVSLYSLMLESVGTSKRSYVTILNMVFYNCGFCLLSLLAYSIRSWRLMTLFISLLGLFFLPMWRFIPESPRWLLVQGREDEARAVLAKIARGNGRKMTVSRLKRPTNQSSDATTSVSMIELFRGPIIRQRTLILIVAWFSNSLIYYGLAMSAGSLGGGRYISVVLSGLVELPGLYMGYYLLNRWGRKWTESSFLIVAGICCFLWVLGNISNCNEYLTLALALIGKCSIGSAFCVLYLYSAELFPTEIRGLGMGAVSVASRIGGIIAPLILIMGGVSLGPPMVLMGSLGLLAGLLSLYLPETLNQPLPETLSELGPHKHTSASEIL